MSNIVTVNLKENGYKIFIDETMDAMQKNLNEVLQSNSFSKKAFIVSDTNVGKLYAPAIENLFKKNGFKIDSYYIPAGEKSKSLTEAEEIFTRLIDFGLDRKSLLIALGGGVVGDLAGFAAATFLRGIAFIQIPTSLLAQVDSSVGGKTGVNHRLGKNLIGAFYQPKAVFINLEMLKTLPKREISTGLAEIIKYGAIYDENLFAYLEENAEKILELDVPSLEKIISRSCEIKAEVVAQDEKESGLRRILNFGHTIGHAIEKETHYLRYNHGEAVAVGMIGACMIGAELGLCEKNLIDRLAVLLKKMRLPAAAEGCTVGTMMRDMLRDKKTVGNVVRWVLIDKIGHVSERTEVPNEVVESCLKKILL